MTAYLSNMHTYVYMHTYVCVQTAQTSMLKCAYVHVHEQVCTHTRSHTHVHAYTQSRFHSALNTHCGKHGTENGYGLAISIKLCPMTSIQISTSVDKERKYAPVPKTPNTTHPGSWRRRASSTYTIRRFGSLFCTVGSVLWL